MIKLVVNAAYFIIISNTSSIVINKERKYVYSFDDFVFKLPLILRYVLINVTLCTPLKLPTEQ